MRRRRQRRARQAATIAHVAAAHSCYPDTETVLLAPKGDDAATPQPSPNLSGSELLPVQLISSLSSPICSYLYQENIDSLLLSHPIELQLHKEVFLISEPN